MRHTIPDQLVSDCRAALSQFRGWHSVVMGRTLIVAPWQAICGQQSDQLMIAHEGSGCAIVRPADGFSALDLIRGGISITVATMTVALLARVEEQVDLRLLEAVSTTPQRTRPRVAKTFAAAAPTAQRPPKLRASTRSHSRKPRSVLNAA